jgi:predicted permease
MTMLWHDLRAALRALTKNPGFSAVVVLALALGLGVNMAVFDAVNGVLLRPLPVQRHEGLASVSMGPRDQPSVRAGMSLPDYLVVRDGGQVFTDVVASTLDNYAISGGESKPGARAERSELVQGELVSDNFFDVLGVRPVLGRPFSPDEAARPGAEPAILLGHALWRSHFHGDSGIVGRRIYLNTTAFTVIGVLPAAFKGINGVPASYWIPLAQRHRIYGPEDDWPTNRARRELRVLGRLRPGVSLAQAQARMEVLAGALARDFPATNTGIKIAVTSEIEGRYGPFFAPLKLSCQLALFIATLVLLISCANVANLLLSRGTRRTREMGIRLALGAGRERIIRQLLTESVLLALIGGALGALLAFWFGDLMRAVLPPMPFENGLKFEPDVRTAAWAFGASLLAGVGFGALPAWRASAADLVVALKTDLRTEGHRLRRPGLRQLLVVAQIAISVVVVACGGLFWRSLKKIEAIDPGYRTDNLISALVDPGLFTTDEAQMQGFYRELLRRVERLPGVRAVSASLYMPLVNVQGSDGPLIKEGDPPPLPHEAQPFNYSVVSAKYFETMETPLLLGRDFRESERQGKAAVVIVNRELARRLYGRPEDAVGKRFRLGNLQATPLQIIGIARDGRYLSLLEDPRPWIFLPSLPPELHDSNTMRTILVRVASERDIAKVVEAVRDEVQQLDPRLPLSDVLTAKAHLVFSLQAPRMAAGLGAVLALLALGLATMGIYSVMTYTVSQRTREIGIRMALGGRVGDVLRLVLRQGLSLIVAGVVAGSIAAWGVTRLVARFLYGVSASDPLTFLATASLLVLVALLATLVPARRAARVDPMIAFRHE